MSLRAAYAHRGIVYAGSMVGAVIVAILVVFLSASDHVALPFSDPTALAAVVKQVRKLRL